jgi:hypothetical protein
VVGEPDRSLITASILSRSAVSCMMMSVVSIPGVYQSRVGWREDAKTWGCENRTYTSELGTHGAAGLPNLAAGSGEVNFTPGRQWGQSSLMNTHRLLSLECWMTRAAKRGV